MKSDRTTPHRGHPAGFFISVKTKKQGIQEILLKCLALIL